MHITEGAINRIISKGTAKQRAMLILEQEIQSSYFRNNILKDKELEQLYLSFNKEREISIYNQMIGMLKAFSLMTVMLDAMRLDYEKLILLLEQQVQTWLQYIQEENQLNEILLTVGKESLELKDKIVNIIIAKARLLVQFERAKDGFISLNVNRSKHIDGLTGDSLPLKGFILEVAPKAAQRLREAKTYLHACREAVEALGFKNVKSISALFDHAESLLSKKTIFWHIRNEESLTRIATGAWKEEIKKDLEEENIGSFLNFPLYDKIEIDKQLLELQKQNLINLATP